MPQALSHTAMSSHNSSGVSESVAVEPRDCELERRSTQTVGGEICNLQSATLISKGFGPLRPVEKAEPLQL